MRFQHRRQPRRAHPHPDTADSPQPLTPALYPSIRALQLHQCLMEAILNHQNSDHCSSKQDDFLGDESDTVVASAPTATSHERTVAAESPVTNAVICCSTSCTCIPTRAENRRTGEPERGRQSGADANDRESQRNSTPKPDPSRNTRNAPNEAPP